MVGSEITEFISTSALLDQTRNSDLKNCNFLTPCQQNTEIFWQYSWCDSRIFAYGKGSQVSPLNASAEKQAISLSSGWISLGVFQKQYISNKHFGLAESAPSGKKKLLNNFNLYQIDISPWGFVKLIEPTHLEKEEGGLSNWCLTAYT